MPATLRSLARAAALAAASAAFAAPLPAQARPAAPPDLILTGGKVFTADSARPWAEAVAIRGDRIAAVGTSAEVERLAGASTRRIDLAGRVVIPGINDAHVHLGAGERRVVVTTTAEQPANPSLRLVLDSVAAAAARAPAGTLLMVQVGDAVLDDPAARRETLDSVAPKHRVWLRAWSGHGLVLNSAALRDAGLNERSRDPLGGWLQHDSATGRLTGVMHEYAKYNLERRLSARLPDSAQLGALRSFANEAAHFGITSAQDMAGDLDAERTARLVTAARLPIRLRVIAFPATDAAGRRAAAWRTVRRRGGGRLSPTAYVSGVKYILDGTPIERLAVERRAYADRPGYVGRLNFPPDTVRAMLREALAAREQPMFHAVGDSTVTLLLSAMEQAGDSFAWRRLRPRIEHGDGVMPDHYGRAARLGVVVVQNPTHFALPVLMAQRYESARLSRLQPMRSLLEAGIPLALGSDGPLNPYLNILLATTHPNNPSQALTREQAVVAYTRGSAYAENAEREKGTLAPGMLADLAVLSQDIFTVPPPQLPATTSVLTLVGGRAVFDAGVLSSSGGAAPGRRP
ncbi:MAG TPA: amidohydrolase [Gemmatimonadaceae bacterium]|nr:amidohydrolase [Gemmatimonadaceae bacterium]